VSEELLDAEQAAVRLGLRSANALRARCRRAQRCIRGSIEADLGGGITAFKLGTSWRVRFPLASPGRA
jgi:hypothetical protein